MKKLAIALALSAIGFGAQAADTTVFFEDFNSASGADKYKTLSFFDLYSTSVFDVAAGSDVTFSFYYSAPDVLLGGGLVALLEKGVPFPSNVQGLDGVGGTASLPHYVHSNPGAASPYSKLYTETFDGLSAGKYTFKIWAPVALKIDDVKVVVSSVPEPESYAMFLAGLGIMGTLALRRRAV